MSEQFNIPKNEEKILDFWNKNKIFEKTLKARKGRKKFVFYEGPPTANGRPGVHHVLARSFKDLFCRYFTMRGYHVERKAGWDTHGLPVEIEVEKKLGFTSKHEIETFGIANFNNECKKSVWTYKDEWEKITKRIGFWLDFKNPYITYENDYMESVWNIIKKIWDKKLLYKSYKVVPFCPRCETPLSSHEVAQGYKEAEDPSIFIKFKMRGEKNTYFLVWTTTPWTLPSNVALAVGPNVEYVKIQLPEREESGKVITDKNGNQKYQHLILARSIFEKIKTDNRNPLFGKIGSEYVFGHQIPEDGKALEHKESFMFGKDLLNKEYEPLYSFLSLDGKKAHYVIGADFVSTEDGTGIVHIAPAFGEDDMNVGKKHNLPVLMTVEESGKFKKEVTPWAGIFVKSADKKIIEELKERGLMFKAERVKHEYPFCWRCQSPLLYYAKDSWFIKMSDLRAKLIENNKTINWVPDHLKEGRFGEWLKEVKDWALSRERYWATPLPIWECAECKNTEAIGSVDELEKRRFRSKNNYFLLRHGEAENNVLGINSCYPEAKKYGLTQKGEQELEASMKKLAALLKRKKMGGVDAIYSSDIERARQTAYIAAKILNFNKPVVFDERLRELNLGPFNNMPYGEYQKQFSNKIERFERHVEGAENLQDVKGRIVDFIKDTDKKFEKKNVIIISHGDVLWLLDGALNGADKKEQLKWPYPDTGRWKEAEFKNFPYNNEGEMDLHRPYIDEVEIRCSKCAGRSKRVKDVIDVWFDSGAMPFAQNHWPFPTSQKSKIKSQKLQYPAQFISEGIDQTRGWFYTLLAIGTLLGRKAAYKNVVSLGLVLDKNGQKMSKSKGNAVDPWDMIAKFGADGIRWYFYAVNQAGDSKRFDEKEVMERVRKFIFLFYNSFNFLNLYSSKKIDIFSYKPKKILDRWIISRLNNTINSVNKSMTAYDATSAARTIEEFVDDLSVWHLRRSRKRLQMPRDKKEKDEAEKTLAVIFIALSKLSAPFVPFFAEEIYISLKKFVSGYSFKESVHLELYPKNMKIDEPLEKEMKTIRSVVNTGHRLRADAGIKVRQPLNLLIIKRKKKIANELLMLIAEELNVKEAKMTELIPATLRCVEETEFAVGLDCEMTADLFEGGIIREVIRNIQDARKKLLLLPKDKIHVSVSCENSPAGDNLIKILTKHASQIEKEAIIADFKIGVKDEKLRFEKEFSVDGIKTTITIR